MDLTGNTLDFFIGVLKLHQCNAAVRFFGIGDGGAEEVPGQMSELVPLKTIRLF